MNRRQIVKAAAVAASSLILGGSMTQPVATQGGGGDVVANTRLQQQVDDATVMRIGRVVRFDADSITVAISGSEVLVNAPYLFGVYQPVLGDNVVVLRSGASWVVLGGLTGNPTDNVLLNSSFEDDTAGVPDNWTLQMITNAAGTIAFTASSGLLIGKDISGPQKAKLSLVSTGGGFSESLIISAPVPAVAGQIWGGAVSLTGYTTLQGFGDSSYAYLQVGFYADPVTTTAIQTFDSQLVWLSPLRMSDWVLMTTPGTGAIAPPGTAYVRLGLGLHCAANSAGVEGTVYFDRAILRRIS